MTKYIMQRLLATVITMFVILTIGFLVIRLMPGSIFDGYDEMTPEMMQALNAKYNFDKPVIVQYFIYLKNILLHWDWGISLKMNPNVPVWTIVKQKIPVTLYVNFYSLLLSLPLGLLAGIVMALKKNSGIDYGVSFLVVIFISVPSFVFATGLQYFLAYKFGWFPIIYDVNAVGTAKLHSLLLPILALAFSPIARVARYLRAELAETINSEYMLLARTKGLTYTQATIRHGIRNSLVPLMNIIIPMFTTIMGGSLVVERIFAIPGMGGLMIQAINTSDHQVTLATLMFYSFISIITILLVDLSYGIVDPRIRIGGGKAE
ncbi:MAG: ABC transporter permease [Firmicutes bacterium]|nr:ABC transporter permease [Bacillota bacterium]